MTFGMRGIDTEALHAAVPRPNEITIKFFR
jgi:hypothetical protein